MTEFDLDLRAVEEQIEPESDAEAATTLELGVLDGTTRSEEWATAVEEGRSLVLAVEGDVNERAAGFARQVTEAGGEVVHFRGFLIVVPPGVGVDTDRL